MLNKVILIGRLGADPEVRFMPSGGQVTNIKLATSRKWKDKATGAMNEETEWHRVEFFSRLAEIASNYLKKGSLVQITGRIRTQKYQGQDGQYRYSTGIVAEEMLMLDGKQSQEMNKPSSNATTKSMDDKSFDYNDEIPF